MVVMQKDISLQKKHVQNVIQMQMVVHLQILYQDVEIHIIKQIQILALLVQLEHLLVLMLKLLLDVYQDIIKIKLLHQ